MREQERAEYGDFAASQWRRLVRSGVLLGCSLPEAEDLAQTTLLRCFIKWRHVEQAADPNAYVAQMLNLHRQSRRRRWWREQPTDQLRESSARPQADLEAADAVRRALDGLSDAQRQVIVLRIFLQLPEVEVARILDIRPGTVKSRLSRAIAGLRRDPNLIDLHQGGAS